MLSRKVEPVSREESAVERAGAVIYVAKVSSGDVGFRAF